MEVHLYSPFVPSWHLLDLRCATTKGPREVIPWIYPPVEQNVTHNTKEKAQGGGRGTSPIHSQLSARRRWMISTTLQLLYPREGPGTIHRRTLMGLGISLGGPTGIQLQQPVASVALPHHQHYPGYLSPSSMPQQLHSNLDGFSGLVVSMLAFGTQDCWFKPGQSLWIFAGVKILSMPSSGGEVKESVPCPSFAACKRT